MECKGTGKEIGDRRVGGSIWGGVSSCLRSRPVMHVNEPSGWTIAKRRTGKMTTDNGFMIPLYNG